MKWEKFLMITDPKISNVSHGVCALHIGCSPYDTTRAAEKIHTYILLKSQGAYFFSFRNLVSGLLRSKKMQFFGRKSKNAKSGLILPDFARFFTFLSFFKKIYKKLNWWFLYSFKAILTLLKNCEKIFFSIFSIFWREWILIKFCIFMNYIFQF